VLLYRLRENKPKEAFAKKRVKSVKVTNGRVVIESADFALAISTPEWRLSPAEERQRAKEAEAGWSERKGTAAVQELLADYKIVPEFTKDPMAFVDWGQSKFFTLDDMGEGECAV